jgi:hypothetical protein
MSAIQELMENVNGSSFIAIDTNTPVKLAGGKANPLQGRVHKVVIGSNVMVFQNKSANGYENMVNRRLAKEGKGEFTVGPRQWGERIKDTPFVTHKGTLYLEVIFLKAGKRHFTVDGVVHSGPIQGLVEDNEEGHQGGLEDKVIIRTYKVANITHININGKQFAL